MTKEEQLQKLARTLVKSGLTSSYNEALGKAREILRIPAPSAEKREEKPADPSTLPKIDEIRPAPVSLGFDFEQDRNLREIVEEDSKEIYGRRSSGQ